jgi:hypothetical protein
VLVEHRTVTGIGARWAARLLAGSVLVVAVGVLLQLTPAGPPGVPPGAWPTAHALGAEGPTRLRTTLGVVRLAGVRPPACKQHQATRALAAEASDGDLVIARDARGGALVYTHRGSLQAALVRAGWLVGTTTAWTQQQEAARQERAGAWACPHHERR